ncbi:unnamed protein product [Ambrosiozyma monospora]|uniref:Unnamed protein product n=1 Tax=Ambrosiozyma monospora TaxID=43982 RepID=A0A9W6YV35_AMBMO|nr:unnamed protein product [Ambrosiozyma monospora]
MAAIAFNKRFTRLAVGIAFLIGVFLFSIGKLVEEHTVKHYSDKIQSYTNDVLTGTRSSIKQAFTPMTVDEIMVKLKFQKGIYAPGTTKEQIVSDEMSFHEQVLKKKIDEPKGMILRHKEFKDDTYKLANATLLSLVRNKELDGILHAISQIEKNWNQRYHYPITFINEEKFTEEFKTKVTAAWSGPVYFELIPPEIWNKPSNINPAKEKKGIERLTSLGVQYAGMDSYHNMCRFNSGWFYRLEGLKKFKYYWRVEPDVDFFCRVDYDLFRFMEDNELTYGFTISLYDSPWTIETLWPTTLKFVSENPQYVHPNGAFKWLTENQQNPENTKNAQGYSTCHFWSNFEIGDMDFYRGEAYSKWFDSLEEAGGFYYERWGDAPVHSVGLGLFEDKSKIWWFRDIGYHHSPYVNSPNSDKCDDTPGYFSPEDVYDQNCLPNWIKFEMTVEQLERY